MDINIDTEADTDVEKNLNHNFDLAKRTYLVSSKKTITCGQQTANDLTLEDSLKRADLSAEGRQGLARQTAGFFQSNFGVSFESFSFPDFSKTSFEAAKPKDLTVQEDATILYGSVTCDSQECSTNGEYER